MGGGSRSRLFCQVAADATGRDVLRSGTSEATALGAGVLAAVGAGLHTDLSAAVAAMVTTEAVFTPGPDSEVYGAAMETYRGIYPALATLAPRAGG